MLRTADDIIESDFSLEMPSDGWETTYSRNDVIKLINTARKELLEECIERTFIADNNFHPVITKENLQSLIRELK